MITKEKIQKYEKLLAETFIDKSQKERFVTLLKNKKGREKIRHMLPHSIRFNKKLITSIPNNQQTIVLFLNFQP